MKKMLVADYEYLSLIKSFDKKDGVDAIKIFLVLILISFVISKSNLRIASYLYYIIGAYICLNRVEKEGRAINSIGIINKNLTKSLLAGFVIGLLIIFVFNFEKILKGAGIRDASMLTIIMFEKFLVISLTEEIIYRGYIQTRIYGLGLSEIATQMLGGVLFSISHLPYIYGSGNLSKFNEVIPNYLFVVIISNFFIHIILNIVFRKYNNIIGNTIIHGCLIIKRYIFI